MRCAPYCCHVHRTVNAVMNLRTEDREFDVAFHSQPGLPVRLTPLLVDTVRRLGDEGARALLVVPVSFVTDQVETAYRLDVAVRREAGRSGIAHYEVSAPLNCHPLLIRTIADVAAERVSVEGTPLLARDRMVSEEHCPRGAWTGPSEAGTGFDGRCAKCRFEEGEIGRLPDQ